MTKTNDRIWLKIKKFPPWRSYFLYFDTRQYFADSVFAEQKLKVKFEKNEFIKPGFSYIGILCSVKRKDEHRFIAAMDMVKKKILICGHPDYEKECVNFLNGMMKAIKEAKNEGLDLS